MIVEIRTYRLRPGRVDAFVERMRTRALPLLADAGIDVVACGASLDPSDADQPDAYLIRAFPDLETGQRLEAGFYASAAWVDGPREAVLADILDYHTVLVEATPAAVEALRER